MFRFIVILLFGNCGKRKSKEISTMLNLLDYCKTENPHRSINCKYSQVGQDGIIEFILKTIGVKQGFFVEFGAGDGVNGSNCRHLFEQGWNGLFIESDEAKYKLLKGNYKDSNQVICHRAKVGFEKEELFDDIFENCSLDCNIDYCSIDIDGLDLEVFETFERHLPNIVSIEGGQVLPPRYARITKEISGRMIHQSLSVIVSSLKRKGYEILCSYQDCFFIKRKLYPLFDVSSDLVKLYFDGWRVGFDGFPCIKRRLDKVKIKNSLVDFVLSNSRFADYGWKREKDWAIQERKLIIDCINEVEKIVNKKIDRDYKDFWE